MFGFGSSNSGGDRLRRYIGREMDNFGGWWILEWSSVVINAYEVSNIIIPLLYSSLVAAYLSPGLGVLTYTISFGS
jgi:hypothetical protein